MAGSSTETAGPGIHDDTSEGHGHATSFWLWVMCLTGVDYFSTLGYLPSIAYAETGLLAPIATILLVAVTLFGALPIYIYVANKSPKGLGSIALLERLVRGWAGKFMVLTLLGFVATAFFFTKTLSAADAAEHLVHNPLWKQAVPSFIQSVVGTRPQMLTTMVLLMVLGAMFMRGFREVIGLAVVIVAAYLVLNAIIIGSGLVYLTNHPERLNDWLQNVPGQAVALVPDWQAAATWGTVILVCLLFFPKLALGLSGFETGLMVMPLIKGDASDTEGNPAGRIRNTRKLLATAAVIMCFFLLGSSLVTTTLISPEDHLGAAKNRALAFLAHGASADADHEHEGDDILDEDEVPNAPAIYSLEKDSVNPSPMFGNVFGSVYDLATIVILWFAGASAMAGLLNLVPQYLPRYGMAPEWAKALRPLILLFTGISLLITLIFQADVSSQAGPYATGVLVFIASGCTATLIDRWRSPGLTFKQQALRVLSLVLFGIITVVFFYCIWCIVVERPDGMIIALIVIIAIVVASIVSRVARSKELRFEGFDFGDEHSKFVWESMKHMELPLLVPHRPGARALAHKETSIREEHRLGADLPIVFIEVKKGDASEFFHRPVLEVQQEDDRFVLRVTKCASIAHVIATLGLELSKTGPPPEIHFGWSDQGPVANSIGFLLFGEGNVPWMVRELIRREETDPERQPRVVIG